ncbi:putative leucine-rich repeat receptor-like protein kinase [Apostasia shenzhenica]|uniref:Putative leucine-rich repeat receptor-like protein kinase n=1 Tax=Apostasia shenzhenica TaxID=1088818 RepID=A0A2I0APM0_9ASPA|nr:putative leucine-rich repeat receptor-like protein kinase [Apostasia shenzhenica]
MELCRLIVSLLLSFPLAITSSHEQEGIPAAIGDTTVLAIGIANIISVSVAIALVILLYFWFRKKNEKLLLLLPISSSLPQGEKKNGGLICFEGGENLKLELLLKSSAEVLGEGVLGNTYKAVLDEGMVVAVKRLSAVKFPPHVKRLFDRKMRRIGIIKHRNIVSLRAYYSSDEEKLLVYDYMPHGSLQSLMLGNYGRKQRSRFLDWSCRKQVLMGAAHGLHFIHTYPSRSPLVHGNIKPSNILIDEDGDGRVSEWGLTSLLQPTSSPSSTVLYGSGLGADPSVRYGCRAPELLKGRGRATQESDVYSFGMLVLEVVRGKEIDDAAGEEEVMGMVKIGLMCTVESPEARPKMALVVSLMREFLKN